jgi:hypothetical protein
MDVAENGVAAGASLIHITVAEQREINLLRIEIADNGKGMSQEMVEKATDPFFTTRTTRRVGLGLSMMKEAAGRCDGEFRIKSVEGQGTEVIATFRFDHIDLAPLGDVAGSITTLVIGNPDVDFVYTHEVDSRCFSLDTREIKSELGDVPISHPRVIRHLSGLLKESIAALSRGEGPDISPPAMG